MPSRKPLVIGEKFGRWTVLEELFEARKDRRAKCQCDCGEVRLVRIADLRHGKSRSCGCATVEATVIRCTKHGFAGRGSRPAAYRTWKEMRKRCLSSKSSRYHDYGGRGITICDRWLDFENFYADMGDPPSPAHSIERIDNNSGYSPDNCKWATNKEQQRNKRTSRMIEFQGQTRCASEWEEILGFRRLTLINRLNAGWSVEKALTTPIAGSRPVAQTDFFFDEPITGL